MSARRIVVGLKDGASVDTGSIATSLDELVADLGERLASQQGIVVLNGDADKSRVLIPVRSILFVRIEEAS